MTDLPDGTVTFLLTDVEGSTALWEQAPEAMHVALSRHDVLFEEAVANKAGTHIRPRGEGDSRFAVFRSAPDAVAAALAIQQAFAAEPWPTPRPIAVRIGIHTGEARLRDGDYYGSAVNRCARLRGIGHGGQVLLSDTTAALVREMLLSGTTIRDLGEHRLKDLTQPEHVWQLGAAGLPSEFPALTSLDARPHNLPIHLTPLLGRERLVSDVRTLFENGARLVTLTGPGGTGKTRLSLQVAAELSDTFRDGVFFVELAPIADPALVPSAIGQVLGLQDVGGRPVLETVSAYLRGRSLLLVLDNFEQILAGAPTIGDLLTASPGLAALVTSREPLRLRGEREYAVPPLALPDARALGNHDDLNRYAAVALFLERAVAIRGDFTATDENASAIAEICTRLDGLPLAIELAAARVRLLSPQAMVERLERRLPLLTGGARDLPTRQQTLRDTIAWSYDLLTDPERCLFRRLTVFVGGWTLEAAEAVCGSDDLDLDVLDGLESLVAKSLVRRDENSTGHVRFSMLETIGEYALERLKECGEAGLLRRRHATYFVQLAEEAAPMMERSEQLVWLARLDAEHDNLRAALTWSQSHDNGVLGVQLAGALTWFWYGSEITEGLAWLASMLTLSRLSEPAPPRSRAAYGAAELSIMAGDYEAARRFANESLQVARTLGDARAIGRGATILGIATFLLGDHEEAARLLLDEAVPILRACGDTPGLARALGPLGAYTRAHGDVAASFSYHQEAAGLFRSVGERRGLGLALTGAALCCRLQNDQIRAMALYREGLTPLYEVGDRWTASRNIEGLAGVLLVQGDHRRAARLFGAAEAMRLAIGGRIAPNFQEDYDRAVAEMRAALGEEQLAAAWAEGRAMSLDQAVAYALEDQTRPS